jgi:hypothetical protein
MVRILHRLDVEPAKIQVHATLRNRNERPSHDLGQLLEQHRTGGVGVHRPAACREPDRHARLYVLG